MSERSGVKSLSFADRLANLKSQSIIDIANKLGLQKSPDQHYYCLNQAHKGKPAALVLDNLNNTFYCDECGINGDIVDLIKLKLNVNMQGALNWSQSWFAAAHHIAGPEPF